MLVSLPAHVRDMPNGRLAMTSVDFPDLSVDGVDADALTRELVRRLTMRLRRISASYRSALMHPRDPELEFVSVSATPEGAEREPVTVKVAIVVWTRQTSSGRMCLVRAPEVGSVALLVGDRADVHTKAASAVAEEMREWDVPMILASDEIAPSRLVMLDVKLPPPAEPKGPNDDLALEDLAEELTQLAGRGRLGRLDQRDPIVDRVLAALSAPGRSSVLLVGPKDVGKSALVGEVAARMAAGEVPPALQGRSLWQVSANELIAGARYTGMWQARARTLLARARADGSVFAMGDPTGIVDAGRWSESSNNLSRVLRPAMESGELSILCECTPEALAAISRKEPSFVDAFHRVDLTEPKGEHAERIIQSAVGRLEAAHGLAFERNASKTAIDLTTRFEPYAALPGKALRLLEEVVQRSVGVDAPQTVDREDVIAAFSERTGLLRDLLSDEVALDLRQIDTFLERRVLGQPEAVGAMVDLVAVVKAGLQDSSKPLGSYFFVGPTGVGKTELAKALAEQLFGNRDRMVRFDMGEYRSGDAVAKLIGSGWRVEQEGELTRRVREQPFCVLLLDEIEKAHPDVFDSLLAVLGEGRLTDASGRTADFCNTVIVMTSNLGAGRSEGQGVGFAAAESESLDSRRSHFIERAERFFRPEFFNRIDRIVPFRSLDQDTIERIARREIGRLVMREGVTRRQLLVEIDDAVVEYCAAAGFHPDYGARPLQREIERRISQPLARILVTKRARPGDIVRFRVQDGDVLGELTRAIQPDAKPQKERRREAKQAVTIQRTLRELADLRLRLERDASDPLLQTVSDEVERLLAATNEPGFWDDPEVARELLARYYQLDQCITRVRELEARVSGLEELAAAMHRSRDQARLPEVRAAIEEIEDAADLLRLEVAGAAAGASESVAVVHASPVGHTADSWADKLTSMYATWAEQTSRQVTRREGARTIEIEGLGSYELLIGENGLHRIATDEGPAVLVRIAVSRRDAPAQEDDSTVIVRHYHDGRRQFVRDPRTGVRTPGFESVIAHGKIGPFLLETARRRSAGVS